jgi:hypothetical protein
MQPESQRHAVSESIDLIQAELIPDGESWSQFIKKSGDQRTLR